MQFACLAFILKIINAISYCFQKTKNSKIQKNKTKNSKIQKNKIKYNKNYYIFIHI
jgi:hypothetical protein